MITQWMRAFVAVAEADSFSLAADRLGITQSTVSKQIAALERHPQVRLLNRTTCSLTLTSECSAFYESSLRALAAIDEAEASVGPGSEVHGLLRLTMPLTLAESRVIAIIADFIAAHPRIRIDMRLSDHALNLVADNIDIAIRVGQLIDSTLVVRRIGMARRMLVASPAYLDRVGRPTTPADLTAYDCLAYSLSSAGPQWRFSSGENVEINGTFKCDSPNALRAAALAGIGIALNARWLFEHELAAGTLEAVLPDYEPMPMPISAVIPSGRHVYARARLFIDHVAAAFARDSLCRLD